MNSWDDGWRMHENASHVIYPAQNLAPKARGENPERRLEMSRSGFKTVSERGTVPDGFETASRFPPHAFVGAGSARA
jgi:hypothetical protein